MFQVTQDRILSVGRRISQTGSRQIHTPPNILPTFLLTTHAFPA
jgi:hypothetical protein